MSQKSAASAPSRNATQFSSPNPTDLSSSVNLFRGDVNYQLPLTQLDNSDSQSNLQVQVALQLESNVRQQVAHWNLDQPTGVLGVGWSLPLEYIQMSTEGALAPSTVSYSWYQGGSGNPLIPITDIWVRASLDASLANGLVAGTAPANLVTAFKQAGLPLSNQAVISGTGPWSISDPVVEHLYQLTLEGSPQALVVSDGGSLFQMQNFLFYKAAYYAPFERFEITDDSGQVRVYGGGKGPVPGYPQYLQSTGNSVVWGVKWGGSEGNWSGGSNQVSSQVQYATCWYLSAQLDRWGNHISYAYNNFTRTNGILGSGAEQPVGQGGLPYTKAIYLGSITDPYGRSVNFSYKDKTYTTEAQEYLDPHKTLVPATTANTAPQGLTDANAWQDRYETLLLDRVTVNTAQGALLNGYDFIYAPPVNVTLQPGGVRLELSGTATTQGSLALSLSTDAGTASVSVPIPAGTTAEAALQLLYRACDDSAQLTALASPCTPLDDQGQWGVLLATRPGSSALSLTNVSLEAGEGFSAWTQLVEPGTAPSGPLAAALCKSYLLAISEFGADGLPQPGYSFDYYWASQGPNLGAIKSLLFPQGGGARYSYEAKALPICQRQQDVVAPTELLGANPVPYVFYGQDYVVSLWSNSASTALTLMVHTWVGRWQRWTIDQDLLYSGASFDPTKLQFFATQDTFAISLVSGSNSRLYLFNRDPHRQAWWQALDNGGQNYIAYSGLTDISYAAGGRFFTVVTATVSAGQTSYNLYRYNYQWQSNLWQGLDGPVVSGSSSQLFVLAHNEYYLQMAYNAFNNQGNLTISYLDQFGAWQDPTGVQTYNGFNLGQNGNHMVWSPDASMAAFSVATTSAPSPGGTGKVNLYMVRWGTNYAFTNVSQSSVTLDGEAMGSLSWPPSPRLVENSTVALGPNVWRFTGQSWSPGSFSANLPGGLNWLAYAHGQDVSVQAANSTGHPVSSYLLSYDADTNSFSQITVNGTTANSTTAGFPHASGEDYLVAGNNLYYRGSASSQGAVAWGWSGAVETALTSLPADTNTTTLVDQAPSFLAYVDGQSTSLILVDNGFDTHAESLTGIYNASAAQASSQGQTPAGANSLTTYSYGSSGIFQQAQQYTLNRYAGYNILGPLADFPVTTMEIVNGYGESRWFGYAYNTATAACDSSGEVVKYFQSTSWQGARELAHARDGRLVTVYLNDIFASGYGMLDGQQMQQITFEGATLFTLPFSTSYGLDPQATPNGAPLNISATPSLTNLSALFANLPTPPLSNAAELRYISLEAPATQRECDDELLPSDWAMDNAGYHYWVIDDPDTGYSYNLDYNLDPTDPSGFRGYVGRVVQSQSNTWALYTSYSPDPAGTKAPLPLHGGFVRTVASANTTDGVPLVDYTYYVPQGLAAPFYNGVARESWQSYDLEGRLVTTTQTTTYGAQVYAALFCGNDLNNTAELLTQVQVAGGPVYQVQAQANDYQMWPGPDGVAVMDQLGTYAWRGATTASALFPFGTTPDPEQWQIKRVVTQRDGRGNVQENRDAAGMVHATARDYSQGDYVGRVVLLKTKNASIAGDEAYACSFEQSEDLSPWSFGGGAAVGQDMAHTGAAGLYLPVGGTARLAPLTPSGNDRVYLVSCYYRLAQPSAGQPGLTVAVSQGSTPVGSPLVLSFDGQPGTWQYAQAPLDLGAYHQLTASSAPLSLNFSVTSDTVAELWLDDLRFSPRDGDLECFVYDGVHQHPMAMLNATHQVRRMTYNALGRRSVMTDSGDQPRTLQLQWQCRGASWSAYTQWLADQIAPLPATPAQYRFNPTWPNAKIEIKCQFGGSFVTARDGDSWQELWTPANPANWSTANGALVCAASGDRLLGRGEVDYGLHFALGTAANPEEPVELAAGFQLGVGESTKLNWTGSQWQLSLAGAPYIDSLVPVTTAPVSLTLLLAGTRTAAGAVGAYLLFYQDGQLLFATATSATGAPSIVTGPNALSLSGLTLMHGPSLQVEQQDATGNTRQTHILAGETYLVNQQIANALGQQEVKTKSVPGTFGSGADQPVLAYRAGLVEMEAFRLALGGSGVMHGDTDAYYDGSDPASGRTDDGHYPYHRQRREASPLQRMVEQGEPGAGYAIIDPFTTSPASRNTIKLYYGNDRGVDLALAGLPEGNYQVMTRVDRSGLVEHLIKDNQARKLGKVAAVSGSQQRNTIVMDFNAQGVITTMRLPNYWLDLPGAEQQVVTRQYDTMGRLIAETGPDSGKTQTLYDAAGRKRFQQDAVGAEQGYYQYVCYDIMGRELQQGMVLGDWADASNYLDQAFWPLVNGDGVTYTITATHTYDGDGTDPNDAGRLVLAESFSGQSIATTGSEAFCKVSSHMQWDARGKVTNWRTVTQWLDGQGLNGDYTVGFSYDNLDQPAAIHYPVLDGVDFASLLYRFDGLERLVGVYDQQGKPFGTWEYDAMGKPITNQLVGATLSGSCGYDSPGDLIAITETSASESLFSSQVTLNPDGTVYSNADRFTGAVNDSFTQTYSYDPLNRLLSATNSGHGDWSQAFSYTNGQGITDLNGNLQSVSGANSASFTLQGNQLTQAQWGGATTAYQYLANGALYQRTSSPAAPAEMPDFTAQIADGGTLPWSMTTASQTLQFAYDAFGNRVGKRVLTDGQVQTTLTLPGPSKPLAEISESQTTAYVLGASQLIAMVRGGSRMAIATDGLGSVRGVFASDGSLIAAYDYLPYGAFAATPFQPAAGWLNLGYTGAVFDPEVGLYNLNARLYDPALGRFIAPDPMWEASSPYIYALGQPNRYTDPSGNLTQAESLLVVAGLAAVGILFMVAMPESVPAFISWGLAGAFTGAASSGFIEDLKLPKNWSSQDFWASTIIGGIAGLLGGMTTGAIVGDEAGITKSVFSSMGLDEESGTFAISDQATRSNFERTLEAGNKIYGKRLPQRVVGYSAGYVVNSVVSVGCYAIYDSSSLKSLSSVYYLASMQVGAISSYAMTLPGAYGASFFAAYGKPALKRGGKALLQYFEDSSEVMKSFGMALL